MTCPEWCTTRHGVLPGEEDWVHQGEELLLADGLTARLCMSVEPSTGMRDGPYLLIGSQEFSLGAAAELGARLVSLSAAGAAYSDNRRNALSRS